MVRVKEFDPEVALERAMELFWRQGYDGTSMADLVEHLGIGRASLYATFGSKRELYLRALDRYTRTHGPDIVRILSAPGPALPAVRAVIELYVRQAAADGVVRGCMVVNAAVDDAEDDPEVARLVERSWSTVEVALVSALSRARGQGELPADRDPQELARFLLVLLQGIKVVGKADPDPDRVRAAADQALSLLR